MFEGDRFNHVQSTPTSWPRLFDALPRPPPGGFHVPAHHGRVRSFEMPNLHLKDRERPPRRQRRYSPRNAFARSPTGAVIGFKTPSRTIQKGRYVRLTTWRQEFRARRETALPSILYSLAKQLLREPLEKGQPLGRICACSDSPWCAMCIARRELDQLFGFAHNARPTRAESSPMTDERESLVDRKLF